MFFYFYIACLETAIQNAFLIHRRFDFIKIKILVVMFLLQG